MRKWYLNNYVLIDIIVVLTVVTTAALAIKFNLFNAPESFMCGISNASTNVIGVSASLIGFVFATITILLGLADTHRSNKYYFFYGKKSKSIEEMTLEEKAQENKLNKSSLFFSSSAYKLTLKALFGSLILLVVSLSLQLIIEFFGRVTLTWTVLALIALIAILLFMLRILFIMSYIIQIWNDE